MGLLSAVTDYVGLTDTGAGSTAAREAGEASARGSRGAERELKSHNAWARRYLRSGGRQQLEALTEGYEGAGAALGEAFTGSQTSLAEAAALSDQYRTEGRDLSLEALDTSATSAEAAFASGMSGAMGALNEAGSRGYGALSSARSGALGALSRTSDQAADYLREGSEAAISRLDPLAEAGMTALERMQSGATNEGYARNLRELQEGGSLDPLIASKRRNLEAELSAQGLTRSGAGIEEMSQLPIEVIMGIESNLYGRNAPIAGYGVNAMTNQAQLDAQRGTGLADIYGNLGANQAQVESQYGSGTASLAGSLGAAGADVASRYGSDVGNMYSNLGINKANVETQYGGNMADIYTNLGIDQANLQTGYGSNLANLTTGYAGNVSNTVGDMYRNLSSITTAEGANLANIYTGKGSSQASAILAGAQADAGDRAALLNMIGTAAGVAAASDARLKTNIHKVDEAGPLGIYEWDWNEEGMSIAGNQPTVGFMAQEVEDLYPQHIHMINGYKAIDYDGVIEELEAA